MQSVLLASETDFDGFRRAARGLLAGGVPPHAVAWRVGDDAGGDDLFTGAGDDAQAGASTGMDAVAGRSADGKPGVDAGAGTGMDAVAEAGTDTASDTTASAQAQGAVRAPAVPSAFVALCAEAVLHSDPDRFALLYRLLWRLVHEPALRLDPLDPDRMRAARMAQAVRRELHRMHAFVRFRPVGAAPADAAGAFACGEEARLSVPAGTDAGTGCAAAASDRAAGLLHVAWFEPACHVVEAAAPFFIRRFPTLRWALLTPERSVRWEAGRLEFGPGARRGDAPPADAGEALWLTYYASIFNPARPKSAAMRRAMPRRYWPDLPEARLIAPLTAAAHARSQAMLDRPATEPRRRIPGWTTTAGGEGATLTSAPALFPALSTDLTPTPTPDVAVAAAGAGAATATMAAAPTCLAAGRAAGMPPAWPGAVAVPPLATTTAGDAQAPGLLLPASIRHARDPGAPPADRAAALAALHDGVSRCRGCPLGGSATQAVPGEGPLSAPLMLVGEQPGDQEDLHGRPFVGPAGRLLDRALADLGWPRERLYLTNAVRHFGFTLHGLRRLHRTPGPHETAACRPWLEAEIALVRPQAVVALGATAARQLLGRPVAVTKERGRWFDRGDGLRVLVTLHPSALLRMPAGVQEDAFARWCDDLRRAAPPMASARTPVTGGG